MKTIKKELIWFVSITLPLTWGIGLLTWNPGESSGFVSRITMYVPALVVVLLYLFKFHRPLIRKNDLGLRFTGWKWWIIAPASLLLLTLATYGLSWLINPEMFASAETIKESLTAKGFYWGNNFTGLIAIILINTILGGLLNIPMFLGEELGWRAFMTPRLLALFTPKKAFIAGGTIWALWHVVMIMQGLNYPGHPLAGIPMMILISIPMGIIIQYFYFRSKSIFVAALAHASINKTAMSMVFVLADDPYNTFLYGPTGIIGIILFSAVAIWLFRRVDWGRVAGI